MADPPKGGADAVGGKDQGAMTLSTMSYFQALNTRMSWLNERQRLLAENVANANTSGFLAKDLAEPDFRDLLRKSAAPVAMARTAGRHIQGVANADATKFKILKLDEAADKSGNSVSLETEMMKVSQSVADHELMSNLYRKGMDLMRIALSRPSRG
ncbi:MAG: flagellar basal body rod protein FlgB [Proteobacteria bacterium]|nr:flagellar basal body rod protein FlgB [Pseudomonadota bacterium]